MTNHPAQFTERTLGPYLLKGMIGHNNASAVYHAVHGTSGREVALRVLLPTHNPEETERFLEEIQRVATLRHPYLVPFVDHGVDVDTIYIAMPLMVGGSLQTRLQKRRLQQELGRDEPMEASTLPSLGEIAILVERLAAGLDFAHARSIIHQQVQPGNILFDKEGRAYLGDTGLTKLFKLIFSLKETNAVITHAYSSPEQWQGERLDATSDQYSLAAVVYLLTTGRMAFESATIFGMMNKHMNEFFIPPHQVRPGLPGELTGVLVRGLGKIADMRYPTVTAFAQDFARAIQGLEGRPTDFFTFPLRDASVRKHDVFIGCAENDLDAAQRVTAALQPHGISAWSGDDLRPGSLAWKAALSDAVRSAGVVVVVLSSGAMRSEWVNLALSLAHKHRKQTIAFTLEGVEGHRAAFSRMIHAAGDEAASIAQLAAAVKALLT